MYEEENMKDLKNQVAIVTGGSRGIGKTISKKLKSEGVQVVTVQRSKDSHFESIQADLFDPDAPEKIVHEVVSRFGRLDILVNNAGMMKQETVEEITRAQ